MTRENTHARIDRGGRHKQVLHSEPTAMICGHDDDNDEILDNNNALSFVYVSLHDDKESKEENNVEVGGSSKRKKIPKRKKLSLEKKIACQYCEKKFFTQKSADLHACYIHKIRNILHCEFCGKEEKCNAALEQHMLMHSDERRYQCNICGVRLRYQATFNKHMKITHSDNRPYECSMCGKGFKQNYVKILHERRKNCLLAKRGISQSQYKGLDQQYHCEVCGKAFRRGFLLKRHLVSHSNEKPFKCEVCRNAFKMKAGLIAHLKYAHTEVRPYQCSLCPLKFKMKSTLNGHQIVHGDKEDFKCDVCDKTFKWPKSLRKHRILHDRKEVDSPVQIDKEMTDRNKYF